MSRQEQQSDRGTVVNMSRDDGVPFGLLLQRYQVAKGSEFTHTSLLHPTGSFYLPAEQSPEFYRLYANAIRRGREDLYLTERHGDMSPILIDLDFRFDETASATERRFDDTHVDRILRMYDGALRNLLDVGPCYDAYVLLKPGPSRLPPKDVEEDGSVLQDANAGGGGVKDGIHVVIPDVVTRPVVQYMVRDDVLATPECRDLLVRDLGCVNDPRDVIDEAVIHKNPWMMYGSRKPSCPCYEVVRIVRVQSDGRLEDRPLYEDRAAYVERLSIRNKAAETPLRQDDATAARVAAYENGRREGEARRFQRTRRGGSTGSALQATPNLRIHTCEDLEYVERLVNLLHRSRADRYDDWTRLGWCLHNIDHRLLSAWVEFSRASVKFVPGECERMWTFMREGGLGIGTLRMWARQDNPEQYGEMVQQDRATLVVRSMSESHYDVALVVHQMFSGQFVCVSVRQNLWYRFVDHRWRVCDSGTVLRAKFSTDVSQEYMRQAATWSVQGANSDDEQRQQHCAETAKKLNGIALKLKQTAFKDNVMKECRELFYSADFEEKLDTNHHLIGFENGVYDLDAMEFRAGRPEDYVSFSTGNPFVSTIQTAATTDGFSPESIVAAIEAYFDQVFPKPHMKRYVLTLLASFLHGGIREERFHIWTGSGANSKSACIDLFERSFGDYCCKLPVTLLTQKRAASNAATSELARTRGKRCATLQEPSEDERLNVGLMKELTGGDKIQARLIYREPIEFKPQFKMILTCNTLPAVPSDDGGTWRRIRVVEFTSRFCEHPNVANPNEFRADPHLADKFEVWKAPFLAWLIEVWYRRYVDEGGLAEPAEVLECTREYQRNNDVLCEYIEQECERVPVEVAADEQQAATGGLSYLDLSNGFRAWCRSHGMPAPGALKKKDFVRAASRTLGGDPVSSGRNDVWVGWRFRTFGGALGLSLGGCALVDDAALG